MKNHKEWTEKTSQSSYLIKRIQKIVASIDTDAQVILYGSRARGDFHVTSDWDFLILTGHNLNRSTIIDQR